MRKYRTPYRNIPNQYTRVYNYRHVTGKYFRKNKLAFSLSYQQYSMYETLMDRTGFTINPFHYMYIVASPKLLNFYKF